MPIYRVGENYCDPFEKYGSGDVQPKGEGVMSVELTLTPVRQTADMDRLCRDMLRDSKLSERVREEMNRLTAVRLSDGSEENDNAVRVFLRQLVVLGVRDKESPLQCFDMVQAVVTWIVNKERTQDSLHSATEALYALAKREIRLRLESAGAAATPVDGKPAPGDARMRVIRELATHAGQLELPAPAKAFVVELLGPWMMVRLLRYGEASPCWSEAKTFAALFFEALRPGADAKEQVRKRSLRRKVLEQARQRTARSPISSIAAAGLLFWLEHHFAALDERVAPDADPLPAGPPSVRVQFLTALAAVAAA
jgi:hypothetical protein